tara:strand:- start:15496 stop:16041 length:546 start_codon:yes stop_codon:yes gene_type:complete
MAKVRIKSKQWAGFSSFLGPTKFTNGVSDEHVDHKEGQRLGAIMAVELIDDDGNVLGNAGTAQAQVDMKGMKAPVEPKKIMVSDKYEHQTEINAGPVEFGNNVKEKPESEKVAEDLENEISEHVDDEEKAEEKPEITYDRKALEEIADEDGIVGLRIIGESKNVRSNSIESLITKILKSQG